MIFIICWWVIFTLKMQFPLFIEAIVVVWVYSIFGVNLLKWCESCFKDCSVVHVVVSVWAVVVDHFVRIDFRSDIWSRGKISFLSQVSLSSIGLMQML